MPRAVVSPKISRVHPPSHASSIRSRVGGCNSVGPQKAVFLSLLTPALFGGTTHFLFFVFFSTGEDDRPQSGFLDHESSLEGSHVDRVTGCLFLDRV